jgi:PAS domain S-box-containing protein
MQQQRRNDFNQSSPYNSELFYLMVENIKDYAIFMMDTERRVISWNPGVGRLLGYTESEIVGQSADIIFTPEDIRLGAPVKEQETAMRNGSAEDKRWHLRKDGSLFWANGMLMSLKNDEGALRGFAKVMRNETAHKKDEENLEQTKRRFENVLESITDCFFMLDMERRFTYVNPQTEAYFGIPKEQMLDRPFTEVLPKLKGHEILRRHDEAISERKPVHFEALSPVTGKWVELHLYPIKESLAVYFRDISKRRQAEEQLRESREKLKFVLESANIGDWELDLTTGKAMCSFLHDKCFGATEPFDDWSYEKFLTFVHPEDRAEVERKFGQALSGQKEWHFECRVVWADASIHWIEAQGNIYHTVEEKPARMLGIVADLTAHKQAEEQILESEKRYRTLFDSIDEGFCVIELIFDENNQPVDYRFVEVNPTFEKQTGLIEAQGKTARELIPNLEEHWFEIYGRVALTGEAIRFVEGSEAMER